MNAREVITEELRRMGSFLPHDEADNIIYRLRIEGFAIIPRSEVEAMVERAFRDGIKYATICKVSDIDEAWRTSAVRAALKAAMEADDERA